MYIVKWFPNVFCWDTPFGTKNICMPAPYIPEKNIFLSTDIAKVIIEMNRNNKYMY